jgi:hypothetical protein
LPPQEVAFVRGADYVQRLVWLAETVYRWLGTLASLDVARRRRVALYAEKVAATLARAGTALSRLEHDPKDAKARNRAIRELGRITGYIETLVGALEPHLDGRKVAGVKRRLERLQPEALRSCVVSGRKPTSIDRLASAEGYFRALADGLRA